MKARPYSTITRLIDRQVEAQGIGRVDIQWTEAKHIHRIIEHYNKQAGCRIKVARSLAGEWKKKTVTHRYTPDLSDEMSYPIRLAIFTIDGTEGLPQPVEKRNCQTEKKAITERRRLEKKRPDCFVTVTEFKGIMMGPSAQLGRWFVEAWEPFDYLSLPYDEYNTREIGEIFLRHASDAYLGAFSDLVKRVIVARSGGRATAKVTFEKLEAEFRDYKKDNSGISYCRARDRIAKKLGYGRAEKIDDRIKRQTGMTGAAWYKTLA